MRSPKRFIGTIRQELLERILIINERHVGPAAPLRPLPEHSTTETNHIQQHDPLGGCQSPETVETSFGVIL